MFSDFDYEVTADKMKITNRFRLPEPVVKAITAYENSEQPEEVEQNA